MQPATALKLPTAEWLATTRCVCSLLNPAAFATTVSRAGKIRYSGQSIVHMEKVVLMLKEDTQEVRATKMYESG